jgi:dihydropyrimidinase
VFSKATGSPVYFVHMSTPSGIDLITDAHARGVAAIAETCPHYLVLDDSRYAQPDAARYVMTPPLRDRRNQAGLWAALERGEIKAIGSDHCGYSLAQRAGIDDFQLINPGIPGVETSLVVMHTFGVVANRITRLDLVRLLCSNPAKIFGLWPRKGTIAPGSDADVVLFDPRPTRKLSAKELHSRAGFSPYEGLEIAGRVMATICRGRVVYREGKVTGEAGFGRFQPCLPFDRELAFR